MGMQFFLRSDQHRSNFRRALNQLMSTRGETLILSTGYISSSLFNDYNHDDFFNAINDGFKNFPYTEIIIIGGMFDSNLKNQYQFEGFIKYLIYLGYKVTYYKPKNPNWHAKIAMKLTNKTPVIAIIGSSNLTAPAYAEYQDIYKNYKFNVESDLLIWDHDLLDTFDGIDIIGTNHEQEVDFEELQKQKINMLLDTLYQTLQTHDSLKTVSRNHLVTLSPNPVEMLNYLENIFFESANLKLDAKILETICNISFELDEIQSIKKNTSVEEQRFIMNDILDMRPTLNDSKLLSLLNTKIKRYERFSEIIECDQLKENWFYPHEHQKLIEEIKNTVYPYDKVISLIEKLGAFSALEITFENWKYQKLLASLKLNASNLSLPAEKKKDLYEIIQIKIREKSEDKNTKIATNPRFIEDC